MNLLGSGADRGRTAWNAVLVAMLVSAVGALAWAQGSDDPNPMRDMMRRMMQGLVPPPGMTTETLPAAESDGAALVARYCAQCHDLPSPRYKTTTEWPPVFERMLSRMEMMSGGMMGGGMMGMMGRIDAPSPAEAGTLLDYLQRYAMVPAREEELRKGAPADRSVFERTCTQCHTLPSPSLHKPDVWVGIVARMDINMKAMGRPPVTTADREAIVRFLQAAASENARTAE